MEGSIYRTKNVRKIEGTDEKIYIRRESIYGGIIIWRFDCIYPTGLGTNLKILRCEVMNSEFWNIFQWNSIGFSDRIPIGIIPSPVGLETF